MNVQGTASGEPSLPHDAIEIFGKVLGEIERDCDQCVRNWNDEHSCFMSYAVDEKDAALLTLETTFVYDIDQPPESLHTLADNMIKVRDALIALQFQLVQVGMDDLSYDITARKSISVDMLETELGKLLHIRTIRENLSAIMTNEEL